MRILFASHDSLPAAASLGESVVLCDIAFALPMAPPGFSLHHERTRRYYEEELERITGSFIDELGGRLTLWIDHHLHRGWERYRNDRRFLLRPPSEAPACVVLVEESLFSRYDLAGVDTLICHGDLDGIVSAARFLLAGRKPYREACNDAVAADTRKGRLSRKGRSIDTILRARPDDSLRMAVLEHLTSKRPLPVEMIRQLSSRQSLQSVENRRLVKQARNLGAVRVVDCRSVKGADGAVKNECPDPAGVLCPLEKDGKAVIAIHRGDPDDLMAVAAPWEELSLPELLGLPGGSTQRVTLRACHLSEALSLLEEKAPCGAGAGLPMPGRATLEVTRRCTLSCPLCPVGNGTARPMEDMSEQTFRKIIDAVKVSIQSLCLHNYGEPLLHEGIASMISYAKNSGIPEVSLSSNGNNITKRIAIALAESGLDTIRISADTCDGEAYARYRRGGSLERVIEGIGLLSSARQELGTGKPRIEAQALLMRSTEGSIQSFKSAFLRAGADSVRCKTFNAFMSGAGMAREAGEMLPIEKRHSRYGTMNPKPAEKSAEMIMCSWPLEDLVVLADGTVVPCCHDFNGEYPLGKAGELSELWNTEARRMFTARRILDAASFEMCRRCSSAVPALSKKKEVAL